MVLGRDDVAAAAPKARPVADLGGANCALRLGRALGGSGALKRGGIMTTTTRKHLTAVASLALSLLACGRTADDPGTGAAATVVPTACQVATTRKPPLPVKFRFTNQRSAPVYLRFSCVPALSIKSCASGYSDELAPTGGIACLCEYDSCPVGGPCDTTPRTIAPGGSFDVDWDGSFIVTVKKGARECHERKLAVAAKYRVSAAVYGSIDDASEARNPLTTVEAEFGLGTSDLVELTIAP
jgi:hypothetical protein